MHEKELLSVTYKLSRTETELSGTMQKICYTKDDFAVVKTQKKQKKQGGIKAEL